jgi:hypothetical protein
MLILVHGGDNGGIHGKMKMMKNPCGILPFNLFHLKQTNVSLRLL